MSIMLRFDESPSAGVDFRFPLILTLDANGTPHRWITWQHACFYYTKDQIVQLVIKRLPETFIQYKDLTFGGDMRDISVSFEKIKRVLGFDTTLTIDDGVREVLFALKSGLIKDPTDDKYRNAQFIVQ